MGFWARGRAPADRRCSLQVRATDTGGEWLVDLGAGTAERRRAATADAVLAGPAADLYLLLWNRPPRGGGDADPATVGGDPGVLRLWQDLMKVTWS
jgi:MDMPI C-terminal domain